MAPHRGAGVQGVPEGHAGSYTGSHHGFGVLSEEPCALSH